MSKNIGDSVAAALNSAGISQRTLAARTSLSQTTINRIINGERPAKMTELILIASATGYTVEQLAGSPVRDRVKVAARATNGSAMDTMRERLLFFLELDAYLDSQAIPRSS